MDYETLSYALHGGVLTLTLDRPDRLNAITPQLMSAQDQQILAVCEGNGEGGQSSQTLRDSLDQVWAKFIRFFGGVEEIAWKGQEEEWVDSGNDFRRHEEARIGPSMSLPEIVEYKLGRPVKYVIRGSERSHDVPSAITTELDGLVLKGLDDVVLANL